MMDRLALTRLIVAGDRASRRRLLGVVAGVMVAVALFLLLLSAAQAFSERSLRSTWASFSPVQVDGRDLEPGSPLASNELAAASTLDVFRQSSVTVLLVALPKDGSTSVEVPGSDVVPGPGQYLASPALAALISSTPDDQLGDRYGRSVGTLDPSAVEGPDSLVAVIGTTLEDITSLETDPFPQAVTELRGHRYANESYRIITIIGAIAVLVPALLLVGIVTDLGAAQRAERFAALRLIGATPQQVARAAATETGATTLVGSLAGVVLYLALIPLAAQITLGSSRFYPSDLVSSPLVVAATVLLTTLGTAAVAWWRTRRADLGPLGGSRERQERPPRPFSLALLLVGVALFLAEHQLTSEDTAWLNGMVLVAAFVCTMLGLLAAGAVLTWWTARAGRFTARSAAQVVGCNRVAQHPRAVFRSVAGVVVAVYTVTTFAVAMTAAAGTSEVTHGGGRLSPTALFSVMDASTDPAGLEEVREELSLLPGVTTAAVVPILYTDNPVGDLVLEADQAEVLGATHVESPSGMVSISADWLYEDEPVPAEPLSQDRADAVAAQTRGSASASPSQADPDPDQASQAGQSASAQPGPGTQVSPAEEQQTGPAEDQAGQQAQEDQAGDWGRVLLVGTDPDDPAALERSRTALVTSGLEPGRFPVSRSDIPVLEGTAMENQLATLAYIGILVATGISAVSLGVSTVAALLERRRVLGLLRLVGMPGSALRGMVVYETLLPAATALLTSTGLGAFTAWSLIARTAADRTVGWPGAGYYLVLASCAALVCLAVAATVRFGRRMVSGSTVRFE